MRAIVRLLKMTLCVFILFIPFYQPVFAGPDSSGADGSLSAVEGEGPEALADNGFRKIVENQAGALYTDVSGAYIGTFAFLNKVDNSIWYSNHPALEQDTTSFNTAEMMSLLHITYYDEDAGALKDASSKADSVDMGCIQVQSVKQGLRFIFDFPDIEIEIQLLVLLNDDGSLTARIPVDLIKEKGKNRVFSVEMLPFFCSASSSDSGFIFVPDGSGAIIHLNNGKTTGSAYERPVYGGDAGEIQEQMPETAERIYMPVYGMVKNTSAVLAIIESGAPQSVVTAAVSGMHSDFNTVSNRFSLRSTSTYSLDQGWQGKRSFTVYTETFPKIKTVENRYIFLSGKQATLAGMAKAYRSTLAIDKPENDAEPSVYIDILGAVSRKKAVFGFPAETKLTATTFDQTVEILKEIKASHVDPLVVRALEWDRRSVERRIVDRALPEPSLGGKKDFTRLVAYAEEQQIEFYPDVDLIHYGKTSFPFQQYFDATRNMNNQINQYYPYKQNLFIQDTSRMFSYILSFHKLKKTSEQFQKSFNKLGVNALSLSAVGSVVTSDYSGKSDIELWQGAAAYEKLVQGFGERYDLILEDPNLPLAIHGRHLINLPGASRFDITDAAVPFYQMVIAGAAGYAGRPINLEPDAQAAFLRAMATGSGLHYALLYNSDSDIVKNTPYDSWIGADYRQWLSLIQSQYEEMRQVYEKIGGSRLVSYDVLAPGVSKSGFEGGGILYVNETASSVEAEGNRIEPKSYVAVKGGAVVD